MNRLNNSELHKIVLRETLILIKGLLSDEKPEKKLKTIGSWLG